MADPSLAFGPGAVAAEGSSPNSNPKPDVDVDVADTACPSAPLVDPRTGTATPDFFSLLPFEEEVLEDLVFPEDEEEEVDLDLDFLGAGSSHAQKGMNESTWIAPRPMLVVVVVRTRDRIRVGIGGLTNPTSSNKLGNHHIPLFITKLVPTHKINLITAIPINTPINPNTPKLK